jgi:hypothetical protein
MAGAAQAASTQSYRTPLVRSVREEKRIKKEAYDELRVAIVSMRMLDEEL